ncbi:MAG: DNA gyrase subunit A [Bdellovibrionales bacterium]|nr:DNA gyrase subunit A [Bdellovibrionales bacterium]
MDSEQIKAVNIENEMTQSYMDYAMSVIIGRALPDARDGLKPVQKRVLYAMLREGLAANKKHSKCAGVVGEVLKKYHPHGDSSVYDALARLAQPWNLRYPLIDGQGNFGSIDGDPPAAYRYTECRMTALAEKLLEDIDKDTVDFISNFDETTQEPVVLPSLFPNLLVNGADGIAVGMATHIPPHNLGEALRAAKALIENDKISLERLMEIIPGPDFPTGGIIHGRGPIVSAYATGKGVVQIRAKTHFEKVKRKSTEVSAIIITEVPYQVNKARLIEKIASLVNEKSIEGISRIREESDRNGMRVVIELKRDATEEVVLNQLFKHTPMQSSYGIINLAIVDGRPVILTLKDILARFIDHRRDVVTRRTQFELKKAEDRMHLLEGFRIALLNLDAVIALIRESSTPKEAKEGLIAKYELTEIQAQAILDLRLQKLTGMERLAVEKEHQELAKEIERLKGILSDAAKVDQLIVNEIDFLVENFSDKRRTSIEDDSGSILIEDLIEDEEMVVTVSHKGYVKRTSVSEYREQKRGGKGVAGTSTKDDEDFIEHLFITSSIADLLVFSAKGRLHWLKVYQIPEAGRTARGRALVNLLNIKEDDEITAVLPVREFREDRFIVMASKQGYIKKIELNEFSRPRKGGVNACTVADDDFLVGVGISSGQDDIILESKKGISIRFSEDQVRPMGRAARGVRGVNLKSDNELVSMIVVSGSNGNSTASDESEGTSLVEKRDTLLTICTNGYGKRTSLSEYRPQGRGGKGIIDIRVGERNGDVIGAITVSDISGVMLITSAGKIIRFNAADISVIGRNTQGVRVINLDEGETVVAIARIRGEYGTNDEAEQ